MAFMKCGGSGSSGGFTETTLWTNSDPTSTFAAQTVTLSDDINNYEYLAFEYGVTNASSDSGRLLISVTDFINGGSGQTGAYPKMSLWASPSGNLFTRLVVYASSTTVYFYSCSRVGASSTANQYGIPWNIIGLN